MKKQTIKLNESQLRNLIKKTINEAVCEDEYDLPWTDREPKNYMDKLRLSRYNGLVEIIEYYSAQEDDGKPLSKEQYEQLKNACDTLECFGEPGQRWAELGREILSRNEHASMNESQFRKTINEGYNHPRHDSFCIVPFDPKSREYRTDIAKPQYFHDDIEACNVARKLINNLPENCVVSLLGMGENRQWEELDWIEHTENVKLNEGCAVQLPEKYQGIEYEIRKELSQWYNHIGYEYTKRTSFPKDTINYIIYAVLSDAVKGYQNVSLDKVETDAKINESKNSNKKKQTIKLNESQLKQIIKESVKTLQSSKR